MSSNQVSMEKVEKINSVEKNTIEKKKKKKKKKRKNQQKDVG